MYLFGTYLRYTVGESSFTIIIIICLINSSNIQFWSCYKNNYFWILKDHSICCLITRARCIGCFLCDVGLKAQNFSKKVWAHMCFAQPESLQFFERHFNTIYKWLINTPTELKLLTMLKILLIQSCSLALQLFGVNSHLIKINQSQRLHS